jgi:hypothetical protein
MNKHGHEHHPEGHDAKREHHKPGWKPHRDWRVWAVVLMLLAMAVYVLTLDESIWPGGSEPAVPAAPAPEAAP